MMFPIEKIFFVFVQWVNMSNEGAVISCLSASPNEEVSFSRLVTARSLLEETATILI